MVKLLEKLDFAIKPRPELRFIKQEGNQDFHSDRALVFRIVTTVDDRHTAPTNFSEDVIPS